MSDCPDALFPSSNQYGIADLDIKMQADYVDVPVIWGSQARTKSYSGVTISFYTDDYRYTRLWERPDRVWQSGAPTFIQPNYSTADTQPFWVAANAIGRKFWLSRYWQSRGMRCFVDMNVSPRWEDLNLAGVPLGWRAWATRVHKADSLDRIVQHAELAESHAGTDDILFVVYHHRKEIEDLCQRRGWISISEQSGIWQKRQSNKTRSLCSELKSKVERPRIQSSLFNI